MGSSGQDAHDPPGQENIGCLPAQRDGLIAGAEVVLLTCKNKSRPGVHTVQRTGGKIADIPIDIGHTAKSRIITGRKKVFTVFIFLRKFCHPLRVFLAEACIQSIQLLHGGVECCQLFRVQSSIGIYPGSGAAVVVAIRHRDGIHGIDNPLSVRIFLPCLLSRRHQGIQIVDLRNIFFRAIHGG